MLRWLRKYDKYLIALFCSGLMVVFLIQIVGGTNLFAPTRDPSSASGVPEAAPSPEVAAATSPRRTEMRRMALAGSGAMGGAVVSGAELASLLRAKVRCTIDTLSSPQREHNPSS